MLPGVLSSAYSSYASSSASLGEDSKEVTRDKLPPPELPIITVRKNSLRDTTQRSGMSSGGGSTTGGGTTTPVLGSVRNNPQSLVGDLRHTGVRHMREHAVEVIISEVASLTSDELSETEAS